MNFEEIQHVWLVAFIGWILSLIITQFAKITSRLLLQSLGELFVHSGTWLVLHGFFTALLGRPWFSMTIILTGFFLVVAVNSAKIKSLREPFIFQDFEYFSDALLHPRLYLPFFGWKNAVAGFFIVGTMFFTGLFLEELPNFGFEYLWQLAGAGSEVFVGILLLAFGLRRLPHATLDARCDINKLGLVPALWRYALDERRPVVSSSFFLEKSNFATAKKLPHLIAVQSESFFDPRPLFAGINSDVLMEFDSVKNNAIDFGRLHVPAWGANTVRSEFSFLTGIKNENLGIHRFNPYRKAAFSKVDSLPLYLKRLGYRTVAVHPYPASFYRRNRVYPRLGFDEFIDESYFNDEMRAGPYVGDLAVSKCVEIILESTTVPTFVFVVTMENHGPLHLELPRENELTEFYKSPPPRGSNDLTIYLRHLKNADRMIKHLISVAARFPQGASLCWYGDHVPIMDCVYKILGSPDGNTEYFIWSSKHHRNHGVQVDISVDQLARSWINKVIHD